MVGFRPIFYWMLSGKKGTYLLITPELRVLGNNELQGILGARTRVDEPISKSDRKNVVLLIRGVFRWFLQDPQYQEGIMQKNARGPVQVGKKEKKICKKFFWGGQNQGFFLIITSPTATSPTPSRRGGTNCMISPSGQTG